MEKITIVLVVILILVNPFIIEFSKSFLTNEKPLEMNKFVFSPDEIQLKDDAFHDAKTSHYTEWWYFDSVFDNNYSVQMSIRIVSAFNHGIIYKRLDIYKDGFIVFHNKKSYLMRDFSASKEKPEVYLAGSRVINSFIDNSTGDWIYDISFEFDDVAANLRFIGLTKGWKGQLHGRDWWGVSLPRAKTSGTLILDNNTINVTGIGYHDHNWEVTATAVTNYGWYWGKIYSNNFTITWASVMKTRLTNYLILVLNKNQDGYLNIDQNKIQFTAENFNFENRHLIPHSFTIISDIDNISINIKMEATSIHHYRFFGFMNYWRYHLKCKGYIIIDSQTENIDNYQVAEFLRFR